MLLSSNDLFRIVLNAVGSDHPPGSIWPVDRQLVNDRIFGNLNRTFNSSEAMKYRAAAGIDRAAQLAFQNHGFVPDLALAANH